MRKSKNEIKASEQPDSAETKVSANIKYRDRLFKAIFGKPENKEWTLSLYNAINGSHYQNADDIEFTTIDDVLYMSMKNDVSFLVEDIMNLYEQQSTYNPNMPMRMFIYAGKIYSNFIENNENYSRFSSKLQKAPAPKCICFYNGTAEMEEKKILKLSDAFGIENPDIDVKVTMLNINYGHNKALLDACKPLNEYSWFVDSVVTNKKKTGSIEKAFDITLDQMDKDALIRPFLMKNKAEVKDMFLTEYDEARTHAEFRADGYEDGFNDGFNNGRNEGYEEATKKASEEIVQKSIRFVESLLKKGFPLEEALEMAEIDEDTYNSHRIA